MDRISNLPDHVISSILEKLYVIDRVKTSTLSRRWRLRWTSVSSLNLGIDFYLSLPRSLMGSVKYVNIINSLVLQHRGDPEELSIFTLPHCHDGSVQHLISHVTRSNNLKRLRLCVSSFSFSALPPSTFSAVNLRHLEIIFGLFSPPSWFEGFPNLSNFLLMDSDAPVNRISHFVSVCPQLVEIELKDVSFIHGQNLSIAAPKLTCLRYEYTIHESGSDAVNIAITAPKLTHLSVKNTKGHVSVSNAENLVSVFMWITCSSKDASMAASMFSLFNGSMRLRHISLTGSLCKLLGSYEDVHKLARFDQMERLEFCGINWNHRNEVLCFLSFCRSSSNVRELKIEGESSTGVKLADPVELEPTMIDKYITNDLGKLVRVDIGRIYCKKIEMKIIELLLRISPILEELHIVFDNYSAVTTDNAKLQFLKPLINFHRASPKAKIHFT